MRPKSWAVILATSWCSTAVALFSSANPVLSPHPERAAVTLDSVILNMRTHVRKHRIDGCCETNQSTRTWILWLVGVSKIAARQKYVDSRHYTTISKSLLMLSTGVVWLWSCQSWNRRPAQDLLIIRERRIRLGIPISLHRASISYSDIYG